MEEVKEMKNCLRESEVEIDHLKHAVKILKKNFFWRVRRSRSWASGELQAFQELQGSEGSIFDPGLHQGDERDSNEGS